MKNTSAQEAVVSSYFNAADARDEWTEILVIQDDLDMQNWTLRDNNSTQTSWQPAITFSSTFWNHLRAGTIILIWHRPADLSGINHPTDVIKTDGYVEVNAMDASYFSGGSFGPPPTYGGTTLVVASGDVLQLRNNSNIHVHALGHIAIVGADFTALPTPKLNHQQNLSSGEAVFVCPGSTILEYGTTPPQVGTTYTSKASTPNITQGLPNTCTSGVSTNSDFWRSQRQPLWTSPSLTAISQSSNTQVLLTWNSAIDPYSSDNTQGYIILRNSVNSFLSPQDGQTYLAGDIIGTANVAGIISTSQTISFTDNYVLNCGDNVYYRIYAIRYSTDDLNGNDFNLARGRAYNETSFASATASGPASPTPPTSASVNRNNFCEDDAGNIILSAFGGSGAYLEWFEGSCGGTLIGTANNLSIPSPTTTTTFYVRWASPGCPPSTCAQVTVIVAQAPTQSDAGPDQSICGVLTTILAGNNPLIGAGLWTKISGPGTVTFVNNTLNTTSITASIQGIYILRWTISNGGICPPSYDEVSIEFSNSVTVIAGSNSPVCSGEDILLTSSIAGATYLWTSSTGFSSNLQNPVISNSTSVNSGTYTVDVSNVPGGCPNSSDQITVTVINTPLTPPISSEDVTGNTQDVCIGSQLPYAIEPPTTGSTYSWNLSGGEFIIYTGTSSLINISWNTPGIYLLTVTETSADGCIGAPVSLNITVNTISTASVTISASNNPVCIGSPVTCTATPENEGNSPVYTWFRNGIQEAITNTPTYTYFLLVDTAQLYVQLSSSSPCALPKQVNSDTILMHVSDLVTPIIQISTSATSLCYGDTATIKADYINGGSSPALSWYFNEALQPGRVADTFNLVPNNGDAVYAMVASNLDCASPNQATSAAIFFTVNQSLAVGLTIARKTTVCHTDPDTIIATPSNAGPSPVYAWYLNGNQVAGEQSVMFTGVFSEGDTIFSRVWPTMECTTSNPATSDTIIISKPPLLKITQVDTVNVTCGFQNGSITIEAVGGTGQIQYSVNDPPQWQYDPVFDSLLPTIPYSVQVKDNLGCIAFDAVYILANQGGPEISASGGGSFCVGDTVTLIAFSPKTGIYEWLHPSGIRTTIDTLTISTVAISDSGMYLAKVTDTLSGCSDSAWIEVNINRLPDVSLGMPPTICYGKSYNLTPGPGYISYLWQDGSTKSTYPALDMGIYFVTVIDSAGCKGLDSVTLINCTEVYFPNAFTPNRNGINETFRPVTGGITLQNYSISIYNRWGQLIYVSNDYISGWDGTFGGAVAPGGLYVYLVKYDITDPDNPDSIISSKLRGTVTVVR